MDERITYEEDAIVSVIIPTYNRINDLIECLNSIIKQTITPKEVIFIDDSDDDQVRDFVQDRFHEFACKGIDLRYIKNSREKSSAIARNIGIGLAKGDFLLFLDFPPAIAINTEARAFSLSFLLPSLFFSFLDFLDFESILAILSKALGSTSSSLALQFSNP